MFERLHICIYAMQICIYGDIYLGAQTKLHIYIYIYIYTNTHTQHETLNNHMQATGAAKSCSQHNITIQWSPSEATAGFYRETSQ